MLEDHLEKIRSFHFAAQEGSFLKAAAIIGLSQPAVTKNIRLLEVHLETTLFVRHRRGVELTKSGKLLYQFSESLLLRIRNVEQQIRGTHQLSGVIKIGTYETLGESFWPKALRYLGEKYPDLRIELTTQDPNLMWNKLESGGIDLIVDAEPKSSDNFFSKVLYTDRFGLFCKKQSRFLGLIERIPISYVANAVDRNQFSIQQHLVKTNHSYELLYDVESFTMARALILNDVCIGVLPIAVASKYLTRGSIQNFILSEKPWYFGEHRICATSLDSTKKDPRIEVLVKTLRSLASDEKLL